jgi:hypothetical protein
MNDMELLQLAAKAANIEIYTIIQADESEEIPLTFIARINNELVRWNPLEDDGDALRLAVELALDVYTAGVWVGDNLDQLGTMVQDGYGISLDDAHGDDKFAATRRSIVRCAARMGEAMP